KDRGDECAAINLLSLCWPVRGGRAHADKTDYAKCSARLTRRPWSKGSRIGEKWQRTDEPHGRRYYSQIHSASPKGLTALALCFPHRVPRLESQSWGVQSSF